MSVRSVPRRVRLVAALVVVGGCVLTVSRWHATAVPPTAPPRPGPVAVGFVENAGQWPDGVRFVARMAAATLRAERDAVALALAGRSLRLRFVDAAPASALCGEAEQPGRSHFLLGNDPARWRRNVRSFGSVRWLGLWPGVDVRLHCERGAPEYDLLLAPGVGAEATRCAVAVDGVDQLLVGADGSVRLTAGGVELVQQPPVAWQVAQDGRRLPVPCGVRQLGPRGFGFDVTADDPELPTVIDPGLVWSSLLGGSTYEWAYTVKSQATGEVTVAGETAAADFPVTAGAFDPTYNGFGAPSADVFVTRFNAAGTQLVWSTYLGGSSGDKPYGLQVDGSGAVTVVGNAASANFPTTPGAFDTTLGGASDGFVARLSADGSQLLWSTFLGGNGGGDIVNAVAVDGSGVVTVTGVSSSSDFPTTVGAYSRTANGTSDAFVTRLSANGQSLLFSTFVGGSSGDVAQALVVDASGVSTITGVTSSTDFPTTAGAFQRTASGSSDVFVTRLSANGQSLLWSTLLGGSNGDVGEGIALYANGDVVVTGVTNSNNFPTTVGAFQRTARGSSDTFVTRVHASGTSLVFSTLIGGDGGDVGKDVVVDGLGQAIVAGQMSSTDYPTTPGAFMTAPSGTADAFVTVFQADGAALVYSTLVGGGRGDGGEALTLCPGGGVAVAGVAGSSDFPVTPGAPGSQLNGTGDAFVSRLSLLPAGVSTYGTSTPACLGPIAIGVNRSPVSGAAAFAVTAARAPQLSAGILILSGGSFPAGLPVSGITVFVDLLQPTFLLVGTSDGNGVGSAALPLTGVPAGVHVFGQWAWLNSATCGGLGTLSASNALDLQVQ